MEIGVLKNYLRMEFWRIIWEFDFLKIKILKYDFFLTSNDELKEWHVSWRIMLEGGHAIGEDLITHIPMQS